MVERAKIREYLEKLFAIYLEKLPKKKFRNIADKDLMKMLDDIEEVHRQKENNLHLVFDGPKSFMEED